jgi:predicted short-subunit dehydrogenase-like oxidoreductase (DUF2520 family)
MTQEKLSHTFAIIGAGKVGTTIARFLLNQNHRLTTIVERNPERQKALAEEFGHVEICTGVERIADAVSHIIICTSDQVIKSVAMDLAELPSLNATFIAHTSGLLSSTELEPLQDEERLIGSVHPIQSFHAMDLSPSHMHGIACGVEGNHAFVSEASALVESLGLKPIHIERNSKVLYHAACVFAGNFITALGEDARSILDKASVTPIEMHHILPMMIAVLKRLNDTSASDALTGPAARGDAESVSHHIQALKEVDEELSTIYALWTKRILSITKSDEDVKNRIIAALGDRDARY